MPLVSPGFLLPDYVRGELGYQDSVVGAQPVVGAEFLRVTPGAFFEVVVALRYAIVASATVINRQARISVLDQDGNELTNVKAPTNQTASTTSAYKAHLSLNNAYAVDALSQQLPLFAFVIIPGWTLRLGASNFQVGDQIQNVGIIMQRYPTGLQPERYRAIEAGEEGAIGSLLFAPPPLSSSSPSPGGTSSAPPPPSTSPPPPATVTPVPAPAPIGNALGGPVIRE